MRHGFQQVGDEKEQHPHPQQMPPPPPLPPPPQGEFHQGDDDVVVFHDVPDDNNQCDYSQQLVKQRRRRRWLVLGVLVVLAMALGAVLAVVLIRKRNDDQNQANRASSSNNKNHHIPGITPTFSPTFIFTDRPSKQPVKVTPPPSLTPTAAPTTTPPSHLPSTTPTRKTTPPSIGPTNPFPSIPPTIKPSTTFPSSLPSSLPSSMPSVIPTLGPTFGPTIPPTTTVPSVAPSSNNLVPIEGLPTLAPSTTLSPSIVPKPINQTLVDQLFQLLVQNGVDSTALNAGANSTREAMTLDFLIKSSQLLSPPLTADSSSNMTDTWWLQRYALTSLYFSLSNTMTNSTSSSETSILRPDKDHCDWRGVQCDDDNNNPGVVVTDISWPQQSLTGTLPMLEWTMLSTALRHVDLSNNRLHGTLPTSLYQLSMLEALYLNSNRLSGRLEDASFVKDVTWANLTRLYLNDNQLTGSIPNGFQYGGTLVRPLRFVLLNHNQLTGTFPANLNWKNLFYLDLGHNRLGGTLPEDVGQTFFALRNLYLDYNSFVGTIPSLWGSNLGGGRMESFVVNNNQLSGSIPTGWGNGNKLLNLEVNYNNFTQPLDSSICDMIILNQKGGNIIALNTDCNICSCNYFCQFCTNSSRRY